MGLGTPAPSPVKRPLSASPAAALVGFSEPEDVAAERLRVEKLKDYQENPIVVKRLNKTYPGLDGQPPKVQLPRYDCSCAGLPMKLMLYRNETD